MMTTGDQNNNKATILDKIIAVKKQEVAARKNAVPVAMLEKQLHFEKETVSFADTLKHTSGIISEFKRRSPSKGIINDEATVETVVTAYDAHGASAISILTDEQFFGGSNEDLLRGRRVTGKPILRKDFIIDEYQLVEAKAIGADIILLIAANLTPAQVRQLAAFAKRLSLQVLLELHAEQELEHICEEVDFIGINNRNLKNFEVNLEHAINLAAKLPAEKLKIAESGINNIETILYLKEHGFDAFLVGEHFMKQPDPAMAFADFTARLSALKGV